MDEHRAQLSSVSSSLADLTTRIVAIADEHRNREHDDLSTDLDEVERALLSASRKLDRLVARM